VKEKKQILSKNITVNHDVAGIVGFFFNSPDNIYITLKPMPQLDRKF
jgi:hypothetical protein